MKEKGQAPLDGDWSEHNASGAASFWKIPIA